VLPLAAPCLADDAGDRAEACFACHGAHGVPVADTIPSLAGEPRQYVSTQLYLYREGGRADPQMAPIAKGLDNAAMNALAEFFAAQKSPVPQHAADPATAVRAQALIDVDRCGSCHGPDLMGLQQMPRLAGQQRAYLVTALHAFKAGTRLGVDGTMGSAAVPLSDNDIATLADYLSGLGAK
jgi:cytochrome c553